METRRWLGIRRHEWDANTALTLGRVRFLLSGTDAQGGSVVAALHNPSPEHIEFDQICAEVDDFETLPALSTSPLEPAPADEEEASLEQQILAGLVSPV